MASVLTQSLVLVSIPLPEVKIDILSPMKLGGVADGAGY